MRPLLAFALLAACGAPAASDAPEGDLAILESVCFEDFDTCVQSGAAPERCEGRLQECLAAVDAMATDCEVQLDQCLTSGRDPATCERAHQACLTNQPPDSPRGSVEGCRVLYGACLDLGLPQDFCAGQLDVCLDVHAPDPCDELFGTCLDLGLDPRYCEGQHQECLSLGGPPDDADDPSDPCVRPDGSTCDEDVPPAPNTCEDEHARCLAAGIDPVSCDRRLAACLNP